MKILHTSDWHLGKKLEGMKRIDEQKKFIDNLEKIVKEERPKVILIAGDIFDTSNPSAEAEKLFFDSVKRLSNFGERAIIIIPGNHDSSERLVAANSLAKEFGIIIYEKPYEIKEKGSYGKFQILESYRGGALLEIEGEKIYVYSLPYPNEVALNEIFEENNYSKRVGEILAEGISYKPEKVPGVIMTHIFVSGASGDGDERNIELGGSLAVSLEDLPEADYIALGHIHKPMKFSSKRAYYSGSPIEYRFTESKFGKKIFVAELKGEYRTEVKEIELENYKPIKEYKVDSIESAIELIEELKDREEWIYLTIFTDRHLTSQEVRKIKTNKNVVEIIPVVQKERRSSLNAEEYTNYNIKDIFIEFCRQEEEKVSEEMVDLFMKLVGDDI